MALRKCKECGAGVSTSAKRCPKCGKKLKHPGIMAILVILAIIVGGSLGTAYREWKNPGQSLFSAMAKNAEQEKFALVSDKAVVDSLGTTYIEGEIKNNTDKQYSYVQVTFILYDADGAQLGTAMANINNLEPNGTWKYKALGLTTERVDSYKLDEITGW